MSGTQQQNEEEDDAGGARARSSRMRKFRRYASRLTGPISEMSGAKRTVLRPDKMAISIPSGQARLHRSAPPAPRIVDDGRPPTDYSSGQIQNMMSRKRTEIEELTKRRERSHAAIQAANTGPLSSFSSMLGCTAMPTCDADGVQVNEEVRRRADRRLAVVSPSRRAPRARALPWNRRKCWTSTPRSSAKRRRSSRSSSVYTRPNAIGSRTTRARRRACASCEQRGARARRRRRPPCVYINFWSCAQGGREERRLREAAAISHCF